MQAVDEVKMGVEIIEKFTEQENPQEFFLKKMQFFGKQTKIKFLGFQCKLRTFEIIRKIQN